MINYDSILSAFDGKPTLLQWLKMVKKALDESILKNVNITQNGEKVVFTFNFEDGTSISTPEVTLTKGDKGDTGATGPKGDTGATGPKGNDGVSITGINTVGSEVVGDKTLTTLRAHYSNDTTDDFVVTAKNGSAGNIYLHSVKMICSNNEIYFNLYSRKETLTIDDVFKQIPLNNYIPMCYIFGGNYAVLSVKKEFDERYGYSINGSGIALSNGSAIPCNFSYKTNEIILTDTLLGDNL